MEGDTAAQIKQRVKKVVGVSSVSDTRRNETVPPVILHPLVSKQTVAAVTTKSASSVQNCGPEKTTSIPPKQITRFAISRTHSPSSCTGSGKFLEIRVVERVEVTETFTSSGSSEVSSASSASLGDAAAPIRKRDPELSRAPAANTSQLPVYRLSDSDSDTESTGASSMVSEELFSAILRC